MTSPTRRALVVRPGRYRTRDGNVAVVVDNCGDDAKWPWLGHTVSHPHVKVSWGNDGIWYSSAKRNAYDLMKRLPDKPKPAPRKRVDLNLGHLDPWTALKAISTLAHKALTKGKRVDDWRVLTEILGKCNATVAIRKQLPVRRKGGGNE